MPHLCPVPRWELSQGAQCQLRLPPSTAGAKPSWSGVASPAAPSHSGSHSAIRGAIAYRGYGARWAAPAVSAAARDGSGDLQQLPPGQDVTGRQKPSHTLAPHQSPPASPAPRSDAKPGALLCLWRDIFFFFFSNPALPLGLPAGTGRAGREPAGAEPVPALLSSACRGSPLPRAGDSSWGRQ